MNLNKKAFSVVELIVVFTIIGFIVVMELIILNAKVNDYAHPYYNAYNTLRKANYNILADMYCPDPNSEDEDCRKGPRVYPDESKKLCKRLTEFINTSDKFCDSKDIEIITDNADNIDPKKPHFIASNSFRYYLGEKKSIEVPNSIGGTDTIEYFVVYVDLNGEKRPNVITCDNGPRVLPDIVPFALTKRGEVIPMGFPVYSKTYMTAKIQYPSNMSSVGDVENKQSPSLSFYEAAYGAWPPNDDINTTNKEVFRYIDIPFSIMFSDDDIYENSNIRQCYNGTASEMKMADEYKQEAKSHYDRGCMGGTFDCKVVIDSSAHVRY